MKIIIDAGHGGSDPGAVYRDMAEKDITLRLAMMLRHRLSDYGSLNVRLTRDDDLFVPLDVRVAIANTWNADYFLSIHCNADADADTPGMPEATGAEAYYLSEPGRLFAEQVGAGFKRELPGEPWRGAKQAPLYVVKHTNAVAVLAEVAFIDTSVSERRLNDAGTRRLIVSALTRAVLAL